MMNDKPVSEFSVDKLQLKIFRNRTIMGIFAASAVALKMRLLFKEKEQIRMIFAAAPSQNDFLKSLAGMDDIDWTRVTAFHMDEYLGLEKDAPQGFGTYLRQNIFDKVSFRKIHYINPMTPDPQSECRRYAQLIEQAPIDIICLGIGENGHIAFNDPPVADFQDRETVKVVKLDKECRQQQVNDSCFSKFADVPTHAITITIPVFLKADCLSTVVPGERKASAVYNTLNSEISTSCPATILRQHANASLFLDSDSARLVDV